MVLAIGNGEYYLAVVAPPAIFGGFFNLAWMAWVWVGGACGYARQRSK